MVSLWGSLTKQISGISSESDTEAELGEAQKFSYLSLQAATENFSDHNLIRVGGFAQMYRGVLPNGALIAVGKYRPERNCDFASSSTVEIFSCIRHPNVNRIIGYCFNKKYRLLVFKHTSNGSLRDLLRDKEKRESVFNWPMRVAVCNGIARGLHHLHQQINPCVIHRDIKPSNVLLDSNFTPKITGFDIVKFVYGSPLEEEKGEEEEEYEAVVGTYGYLDPEYLETRKCKRKSDVYGFGVVMLVIISGRKAHESGFYLTRWALDLLAKGRVLEIVDPVLADFSVDQVLGFIDVALSCVKDESSLRPTMAEVIPMLSRVCGSPLTPFEMQPSTPYLSAASSFRSSMVQTYDEIEAESSILDGKLIVECKETAKVFEATETSATHSNAVIIAQQQDTRITVSSSGSLERQYKTTMVFDRPTAGRGENAAYWRKKNMMPRNKA